MKADPQKNTASPRKGDAVKVSKRGWLAGLLARILDLRTGIKWPRRRRRRRRVFVAMMYR